MANWNDSTIAHQQAIFTTLLQKYKFQPRSPQSQDAQEIAIYISNTAEELAHETGKQRQRAAPAHWELNDSVQLADTAYQVAEISREKLLHMEDVVKNPNLARNDHSVHFFEDASEAAIYFLTSQMVPGELSRIGFTPFEQMTLLDKTCKEVRGEDVRKEAVYRRWNYKNTVQGRESDAAGKGRGSPPN